MASTDLKQNEITADRNVPGSEDTTHQISRASSVNDTPKNANSESISELDQTTTNQLAPEAEPANLSTIPTTTSEEVYTIYSLWEKRFIVIMASLSAAFSPWTANIYYPALNTLAHDLHVTSSKINLTLTTYMIFQAISPTFIGGLGDSMGRRPAYIFCFIIYILSNIALALQSTYAGVLVLRIFQSLGIAGTVALTNGVIADIITSAERGSYVGYSSTTTIIAPSVGPIIGGLLSQYLGWESIFWFLAIFSFVVFAMILVFFPETCRKIVGNGSIPPPKWNRSLMYILHERKARKSVDGDPEKQKIDLTAAPRKPKLRFPNPLHALRICVEKEDALILNYAGFIYAAYYATTTSIPSQYARIYKFNDLEISLLFIPMAIGSLCAAFSNGKQMNFNFSRHAKKLGLDINELRKRQKDLIDFPIEAARLEVGLPSLWIGSVLFVIYGWLLHLQVHVAGPIILLFFIGFTMIAGFNSLSVLNVDINRDRPSTATAALNLVRCLHGAVSTAVVSPMINAMGVGWTFTFWGVLCLATSPMLMVVIKFGPQWRKDKRAREEKKEEKKVVRDAEKAAAAGTNVEA